MIEFFKNLSWCKIGFHSYGKYQDFSKSNYIEESGNTRYKYSKVIQVKKCQHCGIKKYNTQDIFTGYK